MEVENCVFEDRNSKQEILSVRVFVCVDQEEVNGFNFFSSVLLPPVTNSPIPYLIYGIWDILIFKYTMYYFKKQI